MKIHGRMIQGLYFLFLLILLTGCAEQKQENMEHVSETSVPTYARETKTIGLPEKANPYMMYFDEEEFLFFSMEETQVGEDGAETQADQDTAKTQVDQDSKEDPGLFYQFYRQKYEDKKEKPYVTVEEGYVRDYSFGKGTNGKVLAVFTVGENAGLQLYDDNGQIIKRLPLEEEFIHSDLFYRLTLLSNQEFLIVGENIIYHLDTEGKLLGSMAVNGSVRKILKTSQNETYAWIEKNDGVKVTQSLCRIQLEQGKIQEVRQLPEQIWNLFCFEDGFAAVTRDDVVLLGNNGEQDVIFIDLNRQSLLGSQITCISGNLSEIKVVMLDDTVKNPETYHVTLRKTEMDEEEETGSVTVEVKEDCYTEDGRRVIRVAIPDACVYQVEFHAKQFNKSSDLYFVKIERITENLEDYLGKGNRPDVVMFEDHTEAKAYVDRKVLVNLWPYICKQDKYSLEGMLPKVKEILGFGEADSMYAMGGRFRLLLRSSDGTEYDGEGKCSFQHYLAWYDDYLTEKGIWGMGNMDILFYPVLHEFYEEKAGTAAFTSVEFKEIMESYKALQDAHQGKVDCNAVRTECGPMAEYIVQGPRWEHYYGTYPLTEPGGSQEPLCDTAGNEYIYIRVNYPMSILFTSECVEGALDFLLYYNTQKEWLLKGESEGGYGKCGNTYGYFHVFEEYLAEEIYDSEKPLVSYPGQYATFNEEHKEHLKNLLERVDSDTVTQKAIYEMFQEEVKGYLMGDKSLDETCRILQGRATIYLSEHQ